MSDKKGYAPVYAALYPAMVQLFRKHGYALAIHGSVDRDFDVIAVPWSEVSDRDVVIADLTATFAMSQIGEPEARLHGREVYTLSIGHGECFVDLSFVGCNAICGKRGFLMTPNILESRVRALRESDPIKDGIGARYGALCDRPECDPENCPSLKLASTTDDIAMDICGITGFAAYRGVPCVPAIMRQRNEAEARAEKAETERDDLLEKYKHAISQGREFKEERDILHATLRRVLSALGNGSGCTEESSIEFMQKIPEEVDGVVGDLRKEVDRQWEVIRKYSLRLMNNNEREADIRKGTRDAEARCVRVEKSLCEMHAYNRHLEEVIRQREVEIEAWQREAEEQKVRWKDVCSELKVKPSNNEEVPQ